MRHLNIHVKSVETAPHAIDVQVDDQSFEMTVYVITNLVAEDLAMLKNGKYYALLDLERAVDWFNKNQMHWGAGDLIAQGSKQLATLLCAHYGL